MATAICLAAFVPVALGQEPRRVPVDEEIRDEEALSLVKPDYPGLREVSEAVHAGDSAKAKALLARHFAVRKRPVVPPAEFPGVGEGNSVVRLRATGADRQLADETWMRHIFTLSNNDIGKLETFDLGPKIEWMKSPSQSLSWTCYLNQLNVLGQLGGVYRDTRDEKYAKEIGDLIVSWAKQCPRGYGYTRDGKPVDSGMEVRNRLCNCIAAYDVVWASPSLTPEMHMAFWKLFIASCRELMTYKGVSYPGLIVAAVMLPEFAESPQWMEAGKASLVNSLVERTTPEGGWDTHSISYQTVPVPWAARALEFMRANSESGDFRETAEMIRAQTGKLLEIMLWIAMPNGGLPNIGDTYGRCDWSGGHTAGILESYIFSQFPAQEQERLKGIQDLFQRLKATLAAAGGAKADEPATTSIGFPGTGYYVMRSSWEPKQARYLYFDLSAQALGHAHSDACHFDFYAYGRPLLADAGDYFLGWGYRTALHNTIEVDEQPQGRGAEAEMIPHEWLTTQAFDFADGAHSGYEKRGVIHRRKIVFVKPDYFVLCDLLTGTGGHKLEQFFHFTGPSQSQPGEARLDEATLIASSVHAESANAHVIPIRTDGLKAGFVQAQESDMSVKDKNERKAMLGWLVTTGTFQRVKSAVAVYTREGRLPQAFYDVLFPTPRDARADFTVTPLPVSENGKDLPPTQATGWRMRFRVTSPLCSPDAIRMDMGKNLALGATGFGEINQARFDAGSAKKLTDGNPAPREVGGAMASDPYVPNVPLAGRFGVDLGGEIEVNALVLHHGTWNGGAIIYPPEKMTVQYWDGAAWQDVRNAKTVWQDEQVSRTVFDTVRTSRVSVSVARPGGGRLAMREMEAYRVSEEEQRRVEALLHATKTEEWTDGLLISHEGQGPRVYGDIAFDGELACVRWNKEGRVVRLFLVRGRRLQVGREVLVDSAGLLDTFAARWEGKLIHVDCIAPHGIRLLAQGAKGVQVGQERLACLVKDGFIELASAPEAPPLSIGEVRVEAHPPQKGLAGAQPWALVVWRTDRAATSQVEFGCDGRLDRRTPLDRTMTQEHRARVEFLRPNRQYSFRAVSVDGEGRRAEKR